MRPSQEEGHRYFKSISRKKIMNIMQIHNISHKFEENIGGTKTITVLSILQIIYLKS